MSETYDIHLNFAPVVSPIPSFVVHRKLRNSPQEDRPSPTVKAYKLPAVPKDTEEWLSYWISTKPAPGFEPFTVAGDTNRDLTRHMLLLAVRESAAAKLAGTDFTVPEKDFIDEVSFTMARHSEGDELLVVQPYYLRATRQFGLLIDFHFRLAKDAAFTRRVQQLSLSLDKSFRRNLDYYADRTRKIRQFLDVRWAVIETLRLPGSETAIKVSKEFVSLRGSRLNSRTYIFGDKRESAGQFSGLREHGPLAPTPAPPTLLFVFREQDRQAARRLAAALKGTRDRFGFPGFNALFRVEINVHHDPVVLPDLSDESMRQALARARDEALKSPNVIPVVILPATDDNGYLTQKALFSNAEIPTQVCTSRILQDEASLKWAIGNLALQIFCKAGGQPWKVRPSRPDRSLIIGISQSHKMKRTEEKAEIERYFAFSILLDNSGLFQQIHVLGEGDSQSDYLTQLRTSLKEVLASSAETFDRVVIHTSFKLKRIEMVAIEDAVRDVARSGGHGKCRFAVVKVNQRSRFFGVNRAVNSQVPYEATYVKLGPKEYLVWFEGIFPDKTTVTKAFAGPTHLQFIHVSKDAQIPDEDLLQDLVNLSGANWRGFNAKSTPVSVFYCRLVAELVRDFHEEGLPLPAVTDLRPWFL